MTKINSPKTVFCQICQTVDIVMDFPNGLGFINTAKSEDSEESENSTVFESFQHAENMNSTINENQRFLYYGNITISLLWVPAVAFFLIFLMKILNKYKSKKNLITAWTLSS